VTLGHGMIVRRQAFEDIPSKIISNKAGCDATSKAHKELDLDKAKAPAIQ